MAASSASSANSQTLAAVLITQHAPPAMIDMFDPRQNHVVHIKGETRSLDDKMIQEGTEWLNFEAQYAKAKNHRLVICWDGDGINPLAPSESSKTHSFTSVLKGEDKGGFISPSTTPDLIELAEEGSVHLVYAMAWTSPYDADVPKGLHALHEIFKVGVNVWSVIYDNLHDTTNSTCASLLGSHIISIANKVQKVQKRAKSPRLYPFMDILNSYGLFKEGGPPKFSPSKRGAALEEFVKNVSFLSWVVAIKCIFSAGEILPMIHIDEGDPLPLRKCPEDRMKKLKDLLLDIWEERDLHRFGEINGEKLHQSMDRMDKNKNKVRRALSKLHGSNIDPYTVEVLIVVLKTGWMGKEVMNNGHLELLDLFLQCLSRTTCTELVHDGTSTSCSCLELVAFRRELLELNPEMMKAKNLEESSNSSAWKFDGFVQRLDGFYNKNVEGHPWHVPRVVVREDALKVTCRYDSKTSGTYGYFLLGAAFTKLTNPESILYMGTGMVGCSEYMFQVIERSHYGRHKVLDNDNGDEKKKVECMGWKPTCTF